MNPLAISTLLNAVKSGFGLLDQVVEDKDLKNKLIAQQLESNNALIGKLIETSTIPWIDGLVKLMYASVVLFRPIGSFLLTCAGVYMHVKGIHLDVPYVHEAMDAAFPTWFGAREVHKQREETTKRKLAASNLDSLEVD